jgi:2,4-dienoyl-CoA reductase-like NADH-dependent reductase (Old Yellow Enzyme family)
MSSASALFKPYTFRSGAQAKHRITMAPLTNGQSHPNGVCSDQERRWLERHAQGDFAIVMTCASHVSVGGQGFSGQLGCGSDEHLPGLTELASAIHRHGALSLVQLFHGGARSPAKLIGQQPISATAWLEDKPDADSPRAVSAVEIEQIIDDFCNAARRVHRAGFNGVELHGAHGYLLSQFLSRVRNTRADGWGGTLTGRARLLRHIVQRVRRELPAPFIVGVRLSPEDMPSAPGLDLDDSIQVAQWLAEDGVDFIDLSLWNYQRKTLKRPDQHPLPLFRAALPSEVAIFAAGAIWSRQDAQAVVDLGADFVSLGRAAIVDPNWPIHAREPQFEPRRPPLTPEQYRQNDLSDGFITYLHNFKGMVDDSAA